MFGKTPTKSDSQQFDIHGTSKSLVYLGDNDIRDNAQFMMLLFLESYKLKIEEGIILKVNNSSNINKVLVEGHGILLGKTSGMFGQFEYYLNGVPRIFTSTGKLIVSSKDFEGALRGKEDLNYDSKAFIKVRNVSNESRHYGIFYSLKDAIKIVSENDFVKVGEITS